MDTIDSALHIASTVSLALLAGGIFTLIVGGLMAAWLPNLPKRGRGPLLVALVAVWAGAGVYVYSVAHLRGQADALEWASGL